MLKIRLSENRSIIYKACKSYDEQFNNKIVIRDIKTTITNKEFNQIVFAVSDYFDITTAEAEDKLIDNLLLMTTGEDWKEWVKCLRNKIYNVVSISRYNDIERELNLKTFGRYSVVTK